MGERHVHADLIHKWCEGAEIQRRKYASNEWVDTDPDWRVGTEYRIKPRTVKREGWINLYKFNYGVMPGIDIFDTEAEARHKAVSRTVATVKVEWEEVE